MNVQDEIDSLKKEVATLKAGDRSRPKMHLFALDASRAYGDKIAAHLGIELSKHSEKNYEDTEFGTRSLVNVRGTKGFVVQSLYADAKESVNDKIQKMLMFIASLRSASMEDITAIIPYFAYARQGRKVKSREVVATQTLAMQFEAVGTDRVILMDIHNVGEIQNAFRVAKVDNLPFRVEAVKVMAQELAGVSPKDIGVVAPDAGGMSRARDFRAGLEKKLGAGIEILYADKTHVDDKIESTRLVGVERPILIGVDDMIAGGSTVSEFVNAAVIHNSQRNYFVATHGLFVGDANKKLDTPNLHKLIISDTIPPFRLAPTLLDKTTIVSTTKLLAECVRRTYTGDSLSDLFE